MQAWARPYQRIGYLGAGDEQVLAVVEYHQEVTSV